MAARTPGMARNLRGNEREFSQMRDEMEKFDKQRDQLIKQSRDILSNAKYAIYCAHRDDMVKAREFLASAGSQIAVLRKSMKGMPEMESIGAFKAAMQEYAEAYLFYTYATQGKLASKKQIGASADDYLMGLCDFTGEMARRAVLQGGKKNISEVESIRKIVEMTHGELLKFNFRNGELRKKYDSVKWNLKKIEEIMYDLSVRDIK